MGLTADYSQWTKVTSTTGTDTAQNSTQTSSMNTVLGKDAFLKILMTQLKYQDPMDPMDASTFMNQLSQMTQVEQLTNIASTLEDMKETNESGNVSQWLDIIGHQIKTDATTLSGGDTVVLEPSGDYDKIIISLTNVEDGSVTEETINAGDPLMLTYNDTDQVKVAVSGVKDGKVVTCSYSVFQTVQGIQNSSDGLVAILSNGDQYKVSTITEIIN